MEQKINLKEFLEKLKNGKATTTKSREVNNDALKNFLDKARAKMEELKKQSE